MNMNMKAFHNDPEIKQKYINRVHEHREAERLLQSYGYWLHGKGCAVGCTVECCYQPHKQYPEELGLPVWLAHLEDKIFEGLDLKEAQAWPEDFLNSIPVGADVSLVKHQFLHWLLTGSGLLEITDQNRQVVATVAELHRRAVSGDMPSYSEWKEAEASRSASRAAAASSAAVWSASAASVAEAAWSKIATKLLELLRECK